MEITKSIGTVQTSGAAYIPHKPRLSLSTILIHAIIIFFCLLVILPLAWVLLLSIKSIPDSVTGKLWPERFDFTHYGYIFEHIPTVVQNFSNSLIVTTSTVVITSLCAIFAGYALVHLKVYGRAVVLAVLVGSLFFPTRVVSIIGIWEIQNKLGLINTLPGLMLPYVTLSLAISILIMRGIFETISPEIIEAAKMDGASSLRTLVQILLPLIVNGIVVLIIVNFVAAWGEYLLGVTLTNDQSKRTIPVVLASAFGGMGEWDWPRIASVYVMVVTPGIIAFAIAQRWYTKGLQEGALKF